MESLRKYGYSFAAGAFAAGGSFFGKLPSYLNTKLLDSVYFNMLVVNILPIVLMLFCNVMNLRYFLKALQKSEQTLVATVLATAMNFVVSFAFGFMFFHETFTWISVLGAFFIVVGLWFICSAQSSKQKLQ